MLSFCTGARRFLAQGSSKPVKPWQRAAFAVVAVLALCHGDLPTDGLAAGLVTTQWLALLAGLALGQRVWRFCWALAAALALFAWTLHPAHWALSMIVMGTALPFVSRATQSGTKTRRWVAAAVGLAVGVPATFVVVIRLAGGPAQALLNQELRGLWPKDWLDAAHLTAAGFALLLGYYLADPNSSEKKRTAVSMQVLAAAGLLALLLVRTSWFASTLTWPHEMQWCEAPLLLNLLKLRLGETFYGPMDACNSYSYSPLLELIHHALLSPWGLDLTLSVNRALNFLWHGLSVCLLAWSLGPYALRQGARRWASGAVFLMVTTLAVTASFLTAVLHPDHLLMLGMSAAIVLVVAERRLPRWLFWTGIVLVPVFATLSKLTGAGVGVGLVMAFVWPWRPKPLLVLLVSGVLSLATIPLYDATLGDFSQYAIALQASHPIRWSAWFTAFTSGAGRFFVVALLALGAAWWFSKRRHEDEESSPAAVRDATRLALLTVGIMLPSMVAYLKVGGRENSLVPMTLGATAIVVRLLPLLSKVHAKCFGPAALCCLISAAPPSPSPSAEQRTAASRLHQETISLLTGELAEERNTLFYNSTSAWIAADAKHVPLDRWQTISELELARNPAAESFWQRLTSGHYQSVVLNGHVLQERYSNHAARLRDVLERNFERVHPQRDPGPDPAGPMLFRYRAGTRP